MHSVIDQYYKLRVLYKVAAKGLLGSKDSIGVASVDYLMYAGYINMAHHWYFYI